MSTPGSAGVLDEAFERMAASSGFELPNGFVNHGPMACEALAAMRLDGEIERWLRRFERVPGPAVVAVETPELDWEQAIGDYGLLPEWIGHFQLAIDEDGWRQVVETWVPRLLPGLSVKLFHGVIHVAHAVRAVDTVDTPARRGELARALGYWAARYRHGHPATSGDPGADLRAQVVARAEDAARRYLAAPSIPHLHGVTGAMALEMLIDHVPLAAGRAALAQLTADHVALYQGIPPMTDVQADGALPIELAHAAVRSGDVHQVKLVEACQRAVEVSGSPVFAAAAQVVTGRGRARKDREPRTVST